MAKPDLMDRGAENKVVELIKDKKHKLKLGWHLLRNPGQAELLEPLKTRNTIEDEFFNCIFYRNMLL